MIIALLDTNVLWPSLQRDFLLSLAAERLFRPLWSESILEELEETETVKLTRRGLPAADAAGRAARLARTMRAAFDDSCVTGWEPLAGTFGLPDPGDEHVLAAAVHASADVLVTLNVKDFRPRSRPAGLVVETPSDFATRVVAADPATSAAAVRSLAARSGRRGPHMSFSDVLSTLQSRYGMTAVSTLLQDL